MPAETTTPAHAGDITCPVRPLHDPCHIECTEDGRAPEEQARDRLTTIAEFAAFAAARLREHFAEDTLPLQQVLNLAEEAGEFTGAYRRWAGLARRSGTWDDVRAELADVVITAWVTADVLGIDLETAWRDKAAIVMSRGWKETPGG